MANPQSKRILIIDDALDVRNLLKSILVASGAEVFEAETADVGLALAQNRVPNLIITDLQMPDKTGFDFLKEKRTITALNSIPVLVLSGLSDRTSVSEAIALGAADYLLKPIQASSLLQKVRKCMNANTFLKYNFPKDKMPVGQVTVAGEALSVSEVGLQIDSVVKLAPDETVSLSGEVIQKLGVQNVLIRSSKKGSIYSKEKRFITELNFVGIDVEQFKKIRTHIKEWK
jgi:DNA-binding response OmpR family regulator